MEAQAPETVNIHLNGQGKKLDKGATVADVIGSMELEGLPYAVEVNGRILSKRLHAVTILQEGDVLEVVTFVGGG